METATWVQILDETVCISYGAYNLGKGINPTTLTPAMDKIVGQTIFLSFGMATDIIIIIMSCR